MLLQEDPGASTSDPQRTPPFWGMNFGLGCCPGLHTHTHMPVCMHAHAHTHNHAYKCTRVPPPNLHTHICTHMHTNTHTYTCTIERNHAGALTLVLSEVRLLVIPSSFHFSVLSCVPIMSLPFFFSEKKPLYFNKDFSEHLGWTLRGLLTSRLGTRPRGLLASGFWFS